MTVYKRFCKVCKAIFFCGGKGCTSLSENKYKCHCMKCSKEKNSLRGNIVSIVSCPKFESLEEVTIEEL